MKFIKILKLCSLLALSCNSLFGDVTSTCGEESHYGYANFSVENTDLWYSIETHSYPEMTPLSQDRNKGSSEGDVFLSPSGFTIGESGDYWVSFSAVLQNPNSDGVLIPVFLVIDENFVFDDPSLIGGVLQLQSNEISTVHATGILKDVIPGARISLVATNGGDPFPQTVNVVAWNISIHKLP